MSRPLLVVAEAPEARVAAPEVLDDLDEQVSNTLGMRVMETSKKQYLSWCHKYTVFVFNSYGRDYLTPNFAAAIGEDATAETVHRCAVAWLSAHPSKGSPVRLEATGVNGIMAFLQQIRKADGSKPSNPTIKGARSGLNHLYTLSNKGLSPDEMVKLKAFMQGVKRQHVVLQRKGEAKVREGKEPFDWELFHAICMEMVKLDHSDGPFGHLIVTLAWNLMCRTSNVDGIVFEHLSWSGDALKILFAHQKNDQDGDRPRDPRHVYANGQDPAVSTIFALGVYFITAGFKAGNNRLFPTKTYDRYLKILKRVLNVLEPMLKARGLSVKDFGSHSCRKGSGTFVVCGSVGGPNSLAVCLRIGWTMQGVEKRYIRYEAAGDMHVGRTVAGLPLNHAKFALMPPRFREDATPEQREQIRTVLHTVMPNLPPSLQLVAEMALASVVYHRDFGRNNMPLKHRLLQSPLFAQGLVDQLAPLVECRLAAETDRIQPTGIPPMVPILGHLNVVRDTLASQAQLLKDLPVTIIGGVVDSVKKIMEDNALQAGAVTPDGVRSIVGQFVEPLTSKLDQILAGPFPDARHAAAAPVAQHPPEPAAAARVYAYDGHLHLCPADYVLPSGNVRTAVQQWLCPNVVAGVPPLRQCRPGDLPKSQRKRFSDLAFLCGQIEGRADSAGQRLDIDVRPTAAEVNQMFDAVWPNLLAPTTDRGRQRRTEELEWRTAVNLLRKQLKRQREGGQVDAADEPDGAPPLRQHRVDE